MFEAIIGLTAFLAAKNRKESITEMMVASATGGLTLGLIGGLLAMFIFAPLMIVIQSITGIDSTITATITGIMPVGFIAFISVLGYYIVTSIIYALAAAAFYGLATYVMKSINL